MRFFLLCGVALSLSACGFEPMYGTHRFNTPSESALAAEQQLEKIEINNIPNREGQILRNLLIDRFYRHGKPQETDFTLNIGELHESISDLDITKESDSTRAQLHMTTNMVLMDRSGKVLLERDLTAIASYNILTSEFATRVSERNTRENVLNDLARQIELQLALYFKR